ncbi:MAG: hypothetical protein QM597_08725 [Aeromicrobium sp.]|uniref:hypothetical protein n=1 Tax=Aeromicrobium sp. TaxID=1871063 RepID=UPI0039E62C6E
MGRESKRVVGMWLAAVVVTVSWAIWLVDGWSSDTVTAARLAVIAAAVVSAVIAYQTFTVASSRDPLLISSMAVSLVGGAALVSMTMNAPAGQLLPHGPYAVVGVVALIYAAAAMTFAARRT